MSILAAMRERPAQMDTDALLVEAGNLATIIKSGIDKSTQPNLIDRFADVLTELGMQRSYTNAHGTTLTDAQKKMLEPWLILLSSSSGHIPKEETETTIMPTAKQVTGAIKHVMHTPSKPVVAPVHAKPLPPVKKPVVTTPPVMKPAQKKLPQYLSQMQPPPKNYRLRLRSIRLMPNCLHNP